MKIHKRRATIHEVANLAGCSVTTASRVLNNTGYVAETMRSAVFEAIRQAGYVASSNTRPLRGRRHRVVGVVLGGISESRSETLLSALRTEADRCEISIVIETSRDADGLEDGTAVQRLMRQRPSAVLIDSESSRSSGTLLAGYASSVRPVVLLGRRLTSPYMDSVCSDYYRGGEEIAEHLLALGHRDVAYVGAMRPEAIHFQQMAGFLQRMKLGRCEVPDRRILGAIPNRRHVRAPSFLTGFRCAKQLIQSKDMPTAIACRNDQTAFGVMHALFECGVRVPDDVSVTGFGDEAMAAELAKGLTSIRVDTAAEVRLALRLALGRLRGGLPSDTRELHVPCELIVRGSTAPPHT